MFFPKQAAWLVFAGTCGAVMAQQAPSAPPMSPAAAAAAAAEPAPYRFVLEGYPPFADEKVAPWKESNDTVGRIGGWRAYAREAHEDGASPAVRSPAAAPGAKPANPHAGHGAH